MSSSQQSDSLRDTDAWTIAAVMQQQAQRRPDKRFVEIEGSHFTYAEAWRCGRQVANFLSAGGVTEDDFVAVMLPNSVEFLQSWFGLSVLSAVHVAINTDYLGTYLAHVLNNSRARFLIIDAAYLDRVDAIYQALPYLERVYVVGELPESCRFPVSRFGLWTQSGDAEPDFRPTYRDTACVMYTSGTTGPSKGVLMPHAHLYLFGLGTIEHMHLSEDDVFYIVLPLFHANGLFMQLYASMIVGASAVIRRRFSASAWLDDIIEHRATATNSLGVIASFVLNQPPTPRDRDHCLRVMGLAPISADVDRQLRDRFGIASVLGLYGMTEVNIPLYTRRGEVAGDSCGRVWDEFYELEIVDPETDAPLSWGEVGEIVVRPKQPFGFMNGYLNMPEQTVEAWRNFWFHTGDAARMDGQGNVFFVDRIKDCIRRRGENVSSFELENSLASFAGVEAVAAYAVPSDIPNGEDDVMVALVVDSNVFTTIDRLDEFARRTLPAFSLPRYYRTLDSMPKTPTGKIRKHVLRAEGFAAATWRRS